MVQNKYSFFIFTNNILLCSASAFGHNLTKIKQTVMVVQYAEPKIRNKEHVTRTKSTATSTSNLRQAPCTLRQNEEWTPEVTQFMHDIRVSDSKIKTLISETVPRHGWSPQLYIFTILDKGSLYYKHQLTNMQWSKWNPCWSYLHNRCDFATVSSLHHIEQYNVHQCMYVGTQEFQLRWN